VITKFGSRANPTPKKETHKIYSKFLNRTRFGDDQEIFNSKNQERNMVKQIIFSVLIATTVLSVTPSISFARGDGGNGGDAGGAGGDMHDRTEHNRSDDRQDQQDQNNKQKSSPFPPLALDLCSLRIAGTPAELCLDSRL
jgi:hypothetical protein